MVVKRVEIGLKPPLNAPVMPSQVPIGTLKAPKRHIPPPERLEHTVKLGQLKAGGIRRHHVTPGLLSQPLSASVPSSWLVTLDLGF